MQFQPITPILTASLLIMSMAEPAASQLCSQMADESFASAVRLGKQRADCQSVHLLSGEALACHWEFPYRSHQSRSAINELIEKIEACFPTDETGPLAQPVNHPDTHVVHVYDTLDGRIVASLKDKAALGQSFVFLQIQALPQN